MVTLRRFSLLMVENSCKSHDPVPVFSFFSEIGHFVEIGARVLGGLNKQIKDAAPTLSISKVSDFEILAGVI